MRAIIKIPKKKGFRVFTGYVLLENFEDITLITNTKRGCCIKTFKKQICIIEYK